MKERWIKRAIHIFVLTSFAIAQPLFDLLGESAPFFVAHRATTAQMWVFAVAVLVVPPTVIISMLALVAALSPRLERLLQRVTVGGLFALALVPPLVRGSDLDGFLLPLLLIAVVGGTAAYTRFEWIRLYLTWGLVAPLAFIIMFVAFSPARDLFFPPAVAGPLDVTIDSETPVVLLLFDETALGLITTPSGEIDARRFPNFARLAKEATWYPNATTVADGTEWALPAFHTGSMPDVDRLPMHTDYPDNLFSLLGSSYDVEAAEFITRLCPPTICPQAAARADESALFKDALIVYLHSVLPSSLRSRWLPPLDERWAGFGAGNPDALAQVATENLRRGLPMDSKTFNALTGRDGDTDPSTSFDRMIDRLPTGEGTSRWMWYLHLNLPHAPSNYLPNGRSYFGGADIPGLLIDQAPLTWIDDIELVEQALQRQLLQTQFADHLLGQMLDRFEESPHYADAMLVVFSDHGVAFDPGHPRRALTAETADEILPIPLFVKYPDQSSGAVDPRAAELIDVVPTIADVLGVDLPWEVDGNSLLGPADPTQRSAVSHLDREVHDVPADLDRTSLSRFIRQAFGSWGGRYDLYAPPAYLDLMGATSRRLPPGNDFPELGFELGDLSLYESVDLKSGFLPAFVTGSLIGPGAKGHIPLLLTINGRVAGTGLSFEEGSQIRFSGLTTPDLFRDGRNQIDIYAIGVDGRFSPIERVDPGYEVELASDGRLVSVTTPGGQTLSPAGEEIDGRISSTVKRTFPGVSYLQVSGWAADIEGPEAPTGYLVMHDGAVIRVASTIDSPDLAESYGSMFGHSRFFEEFPRDEVPSVDELVFVALFEDRAALISPAG